MSGIYRPDYGIITQESRGRSRSRSRSGSAGGRRTRARTGSSSRIVFQRVPRYLRTKGPKAFTMTCQPFAMALGAGTGATQGINFYGLGAVPTTPTFINNPRFSFGFTLGAVNNYINGAFIGSAANVNYAEYTQLFDSYRIRKVEITMYYNSNSSSLNNTPSLPVISMANDYDDVGSTALESLMQYESYRQVQFGNNSSNGRVVHSLRPQIQASVETTGGSALAMLTKNAWIDCNNTGVLHCGLKGNFDNMNIGSASVGFITFYVKYWVEFKNAR